ncbi:MAG: GNAT family N-acetyltransferase [Dehalococcoidia bacterium]|nr:GNAT family N-acetyltransferase [Dehalococcoidia bacterium]
MPEPDAYTVRAATNADLPAIEALLEAAELPTRGLAGCIETCFVAADAGGVIIAAAGLEPYGEVALLRSVVVRQDRRGTGAGDAVVRAALNLVGEMGLDGLYLFSVKATGFFARFGFEMRPHRRWPRAMRASLQYRQMDRWDPKNEKITGMALELPPVDQSGQKAPR